MDVTADSKAKNIGINKLITQNMATSNPQNRRQRRAATKKSSSAPLEDASSIPLARPPSSSNANPKSKSLYELAAERQSILSGGQPFDPSLEKSASAPNGTKFVKIAPDGTLSSDGTKEVAETADMEDSSPIFDTIFLSLTLSMIHFTLSVLTAHQYAQEFHIPPLLANSAFVAFPLLTFLVHLMHGHILSLAVVHETIGKKYTTVALQGLYLSVATAAGCQLVSITNDSGYYAVMKRAPGIGTVWVWSVMEMGLVGALLGVIGPGVWAWWWGYGIW